MCDDSNDIWTRVSINKESKTVVQKNEISYVERNILKEPLTVNELQGILQITVDGTEGIIAEKSKAYKELNMNLDLDELSL